MFSKRKPHIFILLAVIVLLGMIIPPVCAARYMLTDIPLYNRTSVAFENVYSFDYNARDHNLAIALAQFSQPSNSKIDFTIYYGNYSSVAGSTENVETGLIDRWTNTTVTLGGESKSYTYGDFQTNHVTFSGYARDSEWWDALNASAPGGFLLYDSGYGNFYGNDAAVFYEVQNIGANTIYRITASTSGPESFSCWITSGSPEDVAGGASVSPLAIVAQWVQFAIAMGLMVFAFATATLVWIKFLFVDNLLLTLGLYIGVTMAYAAISSVSTKGFDIFKFYKKFFGLQRSLYKFVVELWKDIIQIISEFRGIFRL